MKHAPSYLVQSRSKYQAHCFMSTINTGSMVCQTDKNTKVIHLGSKLGL